MNIQAWVPDPEEELEVPVADPISVKSLSYSCGADTELVLLKVGGVEREVDLHQLIFVLEEIKSEYKRAW